MLPKLRLFLPLLFLAVFMAQPNLACAAERYDMVQAVQKALDENFKIAAAVSGLNASESGRKKALGGFGPTLGTEYSITRKEHVDDDEYTLRFTLKQNLFSGFNSLAAYQKAALQKDNSEASLAQARISLVQQVQTNFLLYLKAEENVRSAQQSYNRLAEQLKVTKSFYDVGLRPRVEVLQAEVNVSEAEDLLLQKRNALETQRVRLNTLLNIPAGQDVEYVGSLKHIPFTGTLEGCLENAYQKRPDVIIAEKSVAIAEKDKTIAASGFLPSVDASAGWSTTGDDWRAAGNKAMPRNYSSWSLGLTASLSLFKSGQDYYATQQAGHSISKVRAEALNLKQEVVFEVQSRLLDLDNAQKRIVVARKSVEQANEAYRVASARYKSQVGTSIDVLDAQAKLTAAEVSYTGAQADYLSALAAIYAAIGEENHNLQGR